MRPGGLPGPFRPDDGSEAAGSPVPCQRLRRAHATSTPGTARAAGREAPWLRARPTGRAFVPGLTRDPGFDAVFAHFDASAVVCTCSSSRRTPDPLLAGLLPQRSPRGLFGLTQLAVVWTLRLHGEPGGPTSITGTARSVACRPSTSKPPRFRDTPRIRAISTQVRPCILHGISNAIASARPGGLEWV